MEKLRCTFATMERIGKHIKSSKKRYIWGIYIGEIFYRFELFVTRRSKKRKIMVNNEVLFEKKLEKNELLNWEMKFHNF